MEIKNANELIQLKEDFNLDMLDRLQALIEYHIKDEAFRNLETGIDLGKGNEE